MSHNAKSFKRVIERRAHSALRQARRGRGYAAPMPAWAQQETSQHSNKVLEAAESRVLGSKHLPWCPERAESRKEAKRRFWDNFHPKRFYPHPDFQRIQQTRRDERLDDLRFEPIMVTLLKLYRPTERITKGFAQ
jgi:hypothetical protein